MATSFIDKARITVKAGHGGNGVVGIGILLVAAVITLAAFSL